MNASVLGLSNEEINARFNDIAAFADIGDFIEQPVKTYSSGMMVRLAFAVIAHVDADILVIDEALAVGDAFFTQKCMRYLRSFMKTGTVLFASHDTGSIKNLCNYALWLEKGQVIQEGAPKEVCELYLEAFYEAQQGKSSTTKLRAFKKLNDSLPIKDQRLEFINASNLRNDLQIFKFDPDAASFGKGKAQIYDVRLLDENEHPLSWIVGGEKVTLRVNVHAYQDLDSPIIGFFVKDRIGQALFGDNTFLSYRDHHLHCQEGKELQADFVFFMPLLPSGEYSITIAIANGTQETHEQQHWIHDAVLFKSESSSVASGLIGIPMLKVKLQTLGMRHDPKQFNYSSIIYPKLTSIPKCLGWAFAFCGVGDSRDLPKIFVELGTHSGNSYFSFCQSVVEAGISTKCYAVDTWQGDEHAGQYSEEIFAKVNAHNQERYAGFSRLVANDF